MGTYFTKGTTKISVEVGVGLDEIEGNMSKDFDITPALNTESQTICQDLMQLIEKTVLEYIVKSKSKGD